MDNIKAVVFDIDGTITNFVSWTAITQHLGASKDEHLAIFKDLTNGVTDYHTAKSKLLELWKQTGNAKKDYFVQIFESWPF